MINAEPWLSAYGRVPFLELADVNCFQIYLSINFCFQSATQALVKRSLLHTSSSVRHPPQVHISFILYRSCQAAKALALIPLTVEITRFLFC
jgi:hypothetical protein